MKNLILIIPIVLLLISACSVTDNDISNNDIMDLNIPPDFAFSSEQAVDLQIQLENQAGESIPGIDYEIHYVNGNGDHRFLMNAVTNADGIISRELVLPSYVEKLFLRGFMNEFELEIVNGEASYHFGGSQRLNNERNSYPAVRDGFFSYLYGMSYDPFGVPSPIDLIDISPELLARINYTLPEHQNLNTTHPNYMTETSQHNFVLTGVDSTEIWITFVAEGARFKNSLGFYSYQQSSGPPADPTTMEHTLLFPNCSSIDDDGQLESGSKIYLGKFAPGTVVGWFLVQDGWISGEDVSETDPRLYSDKSYNPEAANLRQHSVLLFDEDFESFIIGFEDILRDESVCDNDFNDVVFLADAIPLSNIVIDDIEPLYTPPDDDGDGISNPADDYPNDPERAFDNYYPAYEDSSTIVFEDLWPYFGDYDMNDLVLDYQYHLVTNADDEIVDLDLNFQLRAAGANFDNRFGIILPFTSSLAGGELTPVEQSGSPVEFPFSYVFGTNTTIVEISEPIGEVITQSGFFNTDPDDPYLNPFHFSVSMTLGTPLPLDQNNDFPYNPFLIKNNNAELEIHLMNKPPSFRVSETGLNAFNTGDDASNPPNNYYVASNGLPWAINIPEKWHYPQEKISITEVYLQFAEWAESGGSINQEWYLFQSDRVDMDKVFINP